MKLLLVEDDRLVRITVRDALEEAGFEVVVCVDGTSALRVLEAEAFDIVLSDVQLPGPSGIEIFRYTRRLHPDAAVVLMTGYAHCDDAVTVMREGAWDYISKPFEMDELLIRLGRARQQLEFRKNMAAASSAALRPRLNKIRGASPATRRLLDSIEAAAASDVGVLITGETGTGKDLCARSIHERSRRADKPFVAVNCAAIPENLLESELFGHEKGAFTGADRRRVGRFEATAGGTIFLDEVGELSLASQVKLLRAIETSTFEPLGTSRSISVDVRLIAATNRDLVAAVEAGTFRRDFFYRLNVIDIHTPPLRERRADISLMVADILAEIAARQGSELPVLDPGAVVALVTHDYPGNVRELIHALERAVAMARGSVIKLQHLPAEMASSAEAYGSPVLAAAPEQLGSLASAVDQFEQQYVRRVLEKVDGHRGHAAQVLGISRKSLWQRLRRDST